VPVSLVGLVHLVKVSVKGSPSPERIELADRLRDRLRAANETDGLTWDVIAAGVGTSKPALLNFVYHGAVPYPRTLNAIERWLVAHEEQRGARPGRVRKAAIEEARAGDTPARLALAAADTLLLALNRAVATGEIPPERAMAAAREVKAVSTPEGRAMVEEWIVRMKRRKAHAKSPAAAGAGSEKD
jgi:hypothetical protein